MNPQSDNFEQLQRLLALKRHEQPPPGYFHSFSREIIVRIKAGELGENSEARWWVFDGSWLQKFWTVCERRPALAGGLGVAVCGFFFANVLLSENIAATAGVAIREVPVNQEVASRDPVATPFANSEIAPEQASIDSTVGASDFPSVFRASTTDRSQPQLSLLNQPGFQFRSLVQPVNYQVPSR
jgi:hypothetical protein